MSKDIDLVKQANTFQEAELTGSHQAFRDYTEAGRAMLADVARTIFEDANEMARWMRRRDGKDGRAYVPWLKRMYLSYRLRANGHNSAEAVLEAAKAVVRMAAVHQEFMVGERRVNGRGRRAGRYDNGERKGGV
ncbi:hypothetical protein [Nonomuraea typhae]|uniref:hypothetical protein n=1 Tax=Nonomuraea typhae TaxID=2603600 RepID=UPI0012FCED28|nr:hypothetical protein [Nonomuraea typhae]